MNFTPYDRPVHAAFVGLGRIYDLNIHAYLGQTRRRGRGAGRSERGAPRRQGGRTGRRGGQFASSAELAASGLEVDAVEALLPIPLHEEGVVELLGYGWHVNLQKPMCNKSLEAARRMIAAAMANDRLLRVMENYVFYEPLVRLKELVTSGELGDVSGYHMKMVGVATAGGTCRRAATGGSSSRCRTGAGSSSSTTGGTSWRPPYWLFGPIREVRAWVGGTEVVPGIEVDAPTTIAWEHHSGIRGVWDDRPGPRDVLRSKTTPTTNDGRSPVGRGTHGSTDARDGASGSRVSRSTSTGRCARTTPSMTTRQAASGTQGRRGLRWLGPVRAPMLWSGDEATEVLRFALAAYASSESGGAGVDPASLE